MNSVKENNSLRVASTLANEDFVDKYAIILKYCNTIHFQVYVYTGKIIKNNPKKSEAII